MLTKKAQENPQDPQFDQAEKYVMQAIEALDYAMSLADQTELLGPDVSGSLASLHQQLSQVFSQYFQPARWNQKPPMQAKKDLILSKLLEKRGQDWKKMQDLEIEQDDKWRKSKHDVLHLPDEFGKNINIGDRVEISEGSGIDSGKEAVVVNQSEIKTDGRGVPTNTVDNPYKPVDWKKEVAIKFDDGSLRTMFKNRLRKVSSKIKLADVEDFVENYEGELSDEDIDGLLNGVGDDSSS